MLTPTRYVSGRLVSQAKDTITFNIQSGLTSSNEPTIEVKLGYQPDDAAYSWLSSQPNEPCYRISAKHIKADAVGHDKQIEVYQKYTFNDDSFEIPAVGRYCLIAGADNTQAIWLDIQSKPKVRITRNNDQWVLHYGKNIEQQKTVILDPAIGGVWSLKEAPIFSKELLLYNERDVIPNGEISLKGAHIFCVTLLDGNMIYIDATDTINTNATLSLTNRGKGEFLQYFKTSSGTNFIDVAEIAVEAFSCYRVTCLNHPLGPIYKQLNLQDSSSECEIEGPIACYVTAGNAAASIAITSNQAYSFAVMDNAIHVFNDGGWEPLADSGVNTLIVDHSAWYDVIIRILRGLANVAVLLVICAAGPLLLGYVVTTCALALTIGVTFVLALLYISAIIFVVDSTNDILYPLPKIKIIPEDQALQAFFTQPLPKNAATSTLTLAEIKLLLQRVAACSKYINTCTTTIKQLDVHKMLNLFKELNNGQKSQECKTLLPSIKSEPASAAVPGSVTEAKDPLQIIQADLAALEELIKLVDELHKRGTPEQAYPLAEFVKHLKLIQDHLTLQLTKLRLQENNLKLQFKKQHTL